MTCPVCTASLPESEINQHLDNKCAKYSNSATSAATPSMKVASRSHRKDRSKNIAPIFSLGKRPAEYSSQITATSASSPTDPRPAKRAKTTGVISAASNVPLAARLRPSDFSEFVGQEHLTGLHSPLMHLLQGPQGSAGSMILWGPSGSGKTTLARLLAKRTDAVLKELSATSTGINDVRTVFEEARGLLSLTGRFVHCTCSTYVP